MAGERTVVQAAAELRLLDGKISSDFQRIQGRLLTLAQSLERNIAISIPVTVNTTGALDDLGALQAIGRELIINPLVSLDIDNALNDLQGLRSVAEDVEIPVSVDGSAVGAQAAAAAQAIGPAMAPIVRATGTQQGRIAGENFGTGFNRAVNLALTTGAVVTGSLLAQTLQEGYQRFTTIEDATESLTVALDSAAAAGQLLEDVLNVVRGTPFRLDQFARAATNLVSFGVEAEKVPFYLTAIGEAAATRGSQATAFAQQLADVFGRVQAVGRLMGDEVQSFGSVGVNALAILGNTFGKTTEQIRDMISRGLLPADLALDALAKGILDGTDGVNGATASFGGTMERLGDTLSGSIENFGAARARLGVAIIEPLSDDLTAGFQSITAVIDKFTPRVRAAFEALADSPAANRISEFFKDLPGLIDPTLEALGKFGPLLAPIGAALGARGLGQLSNILGPLGNLVPGVQTLGGALGVAATAFALITPEIRDDLIPLAKQAADIITDFGQRALPVLSDGVDGAVPIVQRLIDVGERLLPVVETAGDLAITVGEGVAPAIGFLGDVLDKVPVEVLTALVGAFVAFKAASGVTQVFDRAGTGIDGFVTRIKKGETDVQQSYDRMFGEGAKGTLRSFEGVAGTATATIGGFFSGMAVQADDAAAQITGAIGGVTSVLLGFKQGGAIGGFVAGGGFILGTLVAEFQEAQREADALAERVESLADRIKGAFDDQLVDLTGVINSEVFADLIEENLGPDAFRTLREDLGVTFEDIQTAARISAEQTAADLEAGLTPDTTFFEGFLDDLQIQLARINAAAAGVEFDEELAQAIVRSTQGAFSRNDVAAAFTEGVGKIGGFQEALLRGDENTRASINLLADASQELGGLSPVFDELGSAVLANSERVQFMEDAIGGVGDAADGAIDPVQAAKDAIVGFGDTLDLSGRAAELWGGDVEAAAQRAKDAMDNFDEAIAAVRDNLNFQISIQDFTKGLRDVTSSLFEVINQDQIDEADQISGQIEDAYQRVADLRDRLRDTFLEDELDRAKIQDELASAQLEGRANAARVLQEILDQFEGKAPDVQADINDELGKLADLEARLANLATEPLTLLETVRRQAAEANLSLFEFLLEAPTPEAQAVFQDVVGGSIQQALAIAQATAEEEGPLAGAIAAESFLDGVRDTLLANGLDGLTVTQLFGSVLENTDFGKSAVEAQIGEIRTLLANAEADGATKFDVETNVDAARIKYEELIAFVEDHPEVDLPVGVSTLSFDLLEEQINRLDTKRVEIETAIGALPSFFSDLLGFDVPKVEVDTTEGTSAVKELRDLVFAGAILPADVDLSEPERKLAELRAGEETTDVVVPVDADTTLAIDAVSDLRDLVGQGAVMPITVRTETPQQTAARIAQERIGEIFAFRHGGITSEATIARSPRIHAFGEWETGGEAYMPLALADRPSSERIFREVAQVFGFDVQRRGEPRPTMPSAMNVTVAAPAPANPGRSEYSDRIEQYNRQFLAGPRQMIGSVTINADSKASGRKLARSLQSRLRRIELLGYDPGDD